MIAIEIEPSTRNLSSQSKCYSGERRSVKQLQPSPPENASNVFGNNVKPWPSRENTKLW